MPGQKKIYKIFICGFITAATLLIYHNVIYYGFNELDDSLYVDRNPYVLNGLSAKNIAWAFDVFDTSGYQPYYHPFTYMSHMLDCHLFGLNAGMHHLTNLVLHILSAILLFILLEKMTGALWKSAFVSILFAVHPINVESVAWVAERKNVLSTFFFMLTLLAYIWYAMEPGIRRYLLVLLSFFFGLMAKPMLIALPCVLLLLDFWPLNRFNLLNKPSDFKQASATHLFFEKFPLIGLSIIVIVMTIISMTHGEGRMADTSAVPISYRLGLSVLNYFKYIYKLIWPHNLGIFYPMPLKINGWQAVYAGLSLFVISGIALWMAKKRPYFIIGWLWFLGTLVPAIGLVQGGAWPEMADRWVYIPAIGLFVIFTWGGEAVLQLFPGRKLSTSFIAATTVVALMITCNHQVSYWSSSAKLFQHTLNITGPNYFANHILGQIFQKQKKYNQAIHHFKKTLEIYPNASYSHGKLGAIYSAQDNMKKAEFHFTAAIKYNPNDIALLNSMGKVLLKQNKSDQAIFYFNRALELDPKSIQTCNNIGMAFMQLQEYEKAAAHFNTVLKKYPSAVETNINMGVAMTHLNRSDEAISHYQKVLMIAPEHVDTHIQLGALLMEKSLLKEAKNHFQSALTLRPDSTIARDNLNKLQVLIQRQQDTEAHYKSGRLYQNKGELQKAIQAYQAALELYPEHTNALFGLAVIYVQQEKFDKAILSFKQLLSIKPDNPLFYYNIACIYSQLNDQKQAVEWLKTSLAHGYDNLEKLKTDTDLNNIHNTDYFQSLLKND